MPSTSCPIRLAPETHDMENAALSWSGPSLAWPDLQNVKISCGSMEADTETSDALPLEPRELHPSQNKGPWILVCLSSDQILSEDFNLGRHFSDLGITVDMVLNVSECKNQRSYELVVAVSCLSAFLKDRRGFRLNSHYNPTEPAEGDGTPEAKRRAQTGFLHNAVKAIRGGKGPGPEVCYRDAARLDGLKVALERAILVWDILKSDSQVLKRFTQNLSFLCLNFLENFDSPPALDLLRRDQNGWLQPFRDRQTDLSKPLVAADAPVKMLERAELQTISLFRSLLEFSGGRVECRQHNFDPDYTTSQNASFCAEPFGVTCSNQFGHFDPREMHNTLLKSNLFAGASNTGVPNTLEWSQRMMASFPIGYPDNHLNLPSQLLSGFGARQTNLINIYFEQTYRQCPSLRKPENNILLLLTWSSTYHGQTLEVLSDWIRSEESLHLYHRLRESVWSRGTPEDLALSLAALLCRERLLPYNKADTAHPIWGSYLADFDAILNGQALSNRRTVFEQTVSSLLRVLNTLEDGSENTIQLLDAVLDKEASVLGPLDGCSDQYWAKRIGYRYRLNHSRAFDEARDGLLKSMEAMLKKDMDADAEWIVVPRVPLRLVSPL